MENTVSENFLLQQLQDTSDDVNIELSDESDDEETDIIENYVERDIFQIYHPQIKQINNQELQSLIKIKMKPAHTQLYFKFSQYEIDNISSSHSQPHSANR